MGIVNLTPDSFSGDGVGASTDAALVQARRLIAEGADILDLGAESSRPGAQPIADEEEIARLLPVVTALLEDGVAISVDTCKPAVMAAVLNAGVDMINDIRGFESAASRAALRGYNCGVCAMHMRGDPATMQQHPEYRDVVGEVSAYLAARIDDLRQAGVAGERIVVDPGFGFGKRLPHNVALFRAVDGWAKAGWHVLVGVSRKSMLGEITGRSVDGRLVASTAAALLAAQRGARILRVHDVGATRDALAVCEALGG
ncbi:MAG TPA: dihydropteroate synthase [Rhodocyclaceae bacterium]